jgi:predicted nucleic acid-binding protein
VVLVDTSVWIRFLAGREPYATGLDDLLGRDEVVGHPLVYGELLLGDRGGRAQLLAEYAKIHQAATVPHEEVVELVRRRRLFGRGVGWIDVHLLASGMVDRAPLWTADASLLALAEELQVAYTGT